MNGDTVWKLLTGFVLIAIIFMLVRPQSPASKAVTNVSDALTAMLQAATGYKWSGSNPGYVPFTNNNPLPA